MMGTYPKTDPLKRKALISTRFDLQFAPVDVAQKAFKDVVRKAKYDVAELALITFLMAYEAGKPYVLLPFVMNGGFHHGSIHCRTDSSLTPRDLPGRKVAMRSYSQTTPTWVRGILSDEFGVRQQDVRWLTREGAHVEECVDPGWVSRTEDPRGLNELLLSGEVDAIIAGSGIPDNGSIRPLIPQPGEAARDWYDRTNVVPVNHMVVIRKEIADSDGDAVREESTPVLHVLHHEIAFRGRHVLRERCARRNELGKERFHGS